jgi:type I restriction enzyme S subunit
MSSEWRSHRLVDIALPGKDGLVDGPFGSNLPSSAYTQAGVPVIRGSNLTKGTERFKSDEFVYVSSETAGQLSRSLCLPNDIVFTKKGTLGQIGLVPFGKHSTYLLSSNQMRMRVDGAWADPEFVYYYLAQRGSIEKIIRDSEHTGVPKINLGYLKSFPIYLPEVRTQRAIASVLSAFDERITVLRETNTTLEAIAQALFKSWFVDFDPVRAKQAGLTPDGMDEATAALFPDAFEESALGLVPKGWQQMLLVDAFEFNPSRPLKKGALAPYLDMASVATSGHRTEAPIQRELGSGTKFRNGDTLLARITPCLENGKAAFVDFLEDDQIGWGSTEFLVLRPKGSLPDYFAYLLCKHQPFLDFAIQSMVGTSGRQRIQNEALGRYPIVVPSDSVAQAFSRLVSAVQSSIAANDGQAQTLAALRDTLLPRLISGQLRLPEAQHLIEEVTA